jgi:hypothetical protein
MTTKEQNGFKLVKTVHLWITVTIIFISIGINIGLSYARFDVIDKSIINHDKRIEILEAGRQANRENIEKSCRDVDEIKINLKILMKSLNIEYQSK